MWTTRWSQAENADLLVIAREVSGPSRAPHRTFQLTGQVLSNRLHNHPRSPPTSTPLYCTPAGRYLLGLLVKRISAKSNFIAIEISSDEMDEAIQLSIPVPRSLDTRIYLHLTVKARVITLFLTTASAEEVGSPTPLGSFVYAIPDVCYPGILL